MNAGMTWNRVDRCARSFHERATVHLLGGALVVRTAGAPRKRRVPSGMKGARTVCIEHDGKRGPPREAARHPAEAEPVCRRRQTGGCEAAGRAQANPHIASSTDGEVEPLCRWRRQHAPGSARKAGALSRGIRDGTSREERVERGRPRLARIATATGRSRPQAEMAGSGEESDGSVVPVKAAKAAGGKGPCSKRRPQQGRIGDCGDTKNSGKDPGTATGALPASQEGAELPSVRAVRQGLPKGRAGPRLRAGEGERRGARA